MDDIKEKIKQALRHIWTNKYRLFLCLLTLCCLFGLVHYFKSADSATASISFNYSEAALGMNPNKTRFNAYEIVSDEVMERAIRRVGLQDSLPASQLAQCLYLSPDGTGSANGSEYISTNYYLSINTRKLNLDNRKPTDLLQSVCESYREIFLSNYCDNQSILKEKLEVTTACEPYLRLNELEVRAAALYGRGKPRPFHQQLYHIGQNDQQSGGLRPAQRHGLCHRGRRCPRPGHADQHSGIQEQNRRY